MRCEDCKKEVELGKIWPDFSTCNICGGGRHWVVDVPEPKLDRLTLCYYNSKFKGTFKEFIPIKLKHEEWSRKTFGG